MSWKNKIDNIDPSFFQNMLRRHFGRSDCFVRNLRCYILTGGFDARVTEGGLYLFELNGQIGNKPAPSVVLKAIPPFRNGQQAVIDKLKRLGHSTLANLLKDFPSNKIGEREVMSYRFLSTKIPLRMPILYYSEFDPKSENAWLFLEDLRSYQSFPPDDSGWIKSRLETVLHQMAAFHAIFWGKTAKLRNETWLGRWWSEQKSDYVSAEIAKYIVNACSKIHPTILTKNRCRLLNIAVGIRPKLHKEFTQEPQTVIHWDFSPLNLCFDHSAREDRKLIVFDWQTTSIGLPQWDIAQLLIPCLDICEVKLVDSLIKKYVNFLPQTIQSTIDNQKFCRFFDLVILDHFFRVCWPILFTGQEIKTDNVYLLEWKHILNWIEDRSAKWLSDF